ncbi:heparinase II/III-family protein, partial [bacterium]|nr:heparinase II/III-family protein [bacterium]
TFQEPAYMMRFMNAAYDLLADSPAMTLEDKLRFVYFTIDNAEFQRIAIERLFYGKENWAANSIGEIVNTAWYLFSAPQARSWIQAADAKVGEGYDFFMADGTWWECSPAHAGYTLRGLCKYGIGKHLLGEPIWNHKFHGKCLVDLIEALLSKMTPFGEFPTINDTNAHDQHLLTDFPEYFQALTLIGRGDLLTMAQAADKPPFIPGTPSIPLKKSIPEINSILFPDGGFGIFRDGWKPDDGYLVVDFGPHGGGHGHYDKLSFLMAADGHHWIPDGGCSPHYCIFPEQESWHRQTISHNTILVNGKSQAEATGKCVMWFTSEKLDAITVMADSCYPGLQHYRTIIHPRNGYFFVYDRVMSEHEAQLEWLMHVNGKPDAQRAGELIFSHESKRLQVMYTPALAAPPDIKQGLVGGFDRHLWDGEGYPEKGQPGWRYIPYFSLKQTAPANTTVTYTTVLCPFAADHDKLTLETRKKGEQMIVTITGEMGIDEIILPAQIRHSDAGGIQFRHKKAETEWEQIIE